ncbi:hypothetical protein R6Q59_001529 [Mikania micrantha]
MCKQCTKCGMMGHESESYRTPTAQRPDPLFSLLIHRRMNQEKPMIVPSTRKDLMIVNMGPHHPSMHGVLRLIVTLDGKDVIDCEPIRVIYTETNGRDVAQAICKAQAETGEIKGYYLNATAGNFDEMMKRAAFARELRVPIVMHDYLTGGFTANTTLAHYCRDNGLLLHIHRAIIPDNACILCITAAAGTELTDAYSPDTVIASSPLRNSIMLHVPSFTENGEAN